MTKARALCVFSLLALLAAGTAHAQTLRWSDNSIRSGAGSMNGDARLKSSIAFASPSTQVYLRVSGWEQVYTQPSHLYIYIWDADNPWSTTPFTWYYMDVSSAESTLYFPVSVPLNHRFSVEVRARCNQDTSYWAPGKTYTYNRRLEVYW
ncbi:MAG TPA: hypothetical protein VIW92_01305 [Thermoanaerobaculia bacterium]